MSSEKRGGEHRAGHSTRFSRKKELSFTFSARIASISWKCWRRRSNTLVEESLSTPVALPLALPRVLAEGDLETRCGWPGD